MNNPLQALLDESEKKIALQNEIINNQKLQISNLNEANQLLKKENRELTQMYNDLSADYDEVVSMCKDQQTILNQLTHTDSCLSFSRNAFSNITYPPHPHIPPQYEHQTTPTRLNQSCSDYSANIY